MAKYLVETYYTCSFKVNHYLEDISEKELSNLEKRDDGKFEILDIKLDNRKTKNLSKNSTKIENKLNDNKEILNESIKPKVVPAETGQGFVKKSFASFTRNNLRFNRFIYNFFIIYNFVVNFIRFVAQIFSFSIFKLYV